jgi:hypothetical protein
MRLQGWSLRASCPLATLVRPRTAQVHRGAQGEGETARRSRTRLDHGSMSRIAAKNRPENAKLAAVDRAGEEVGR